MSARATLLLPLLLAAAAPIAPGDVLPPLRGEYLTGRPAQLPECARGRVALVLVGFSHASRTSIEPWAERFRRSYAGDSTVTCYEVPIVGGMARVAKPFITGGMRRGTPPALHERVITVFGGAGDWRHRLDVHGRDAAYLVLLDRAGRVRWRWAGDLDEGHFAQLQREVAAIR